MKKTNTKVTEAPKPAKAGNRALATRPTQAIQSAPATGGRGFENIERKDILIPRLQLLQALSPAVVAELAKAGTIHVGLSGVNYGKKVTITPILHFRSRIKWVPRDEGGGIECSSPDAKKPVSDVICAACGECEYKDWDDAAKTDKDKAPKCTLYENFLVLVGDATEPILLPMEKTKAKCAKKFFSMGALKNADMWAWQYELSSVADKNKKGEPFFNYAITDLSKRTDPKRMALCEQLWAALSTKTAHIKTDIADEDETGAVAGKPAGAPAADAKY